MTAHELRDALAAGRITQGSGMPADVPKPWLEDSNRDAAGNVFSTYIVREGNLLVILYTHTNIYAACSIQDARWPKQKETWYFCDEDLFNQHTKLNMAVYTSGTRK